MTDDDNIRAFMREMGRRGGLIGGKRRLETMTPDERSAVAQTAALARWSRGREKTNARIEQGERSHAARVVFRKGDVVRLSREGRDAGIAKRSNEARVGRVTGFSPSRPELIWVVWDGTKVAVRYHMNFVEKSEPGRASRRQQD